MENSTNMTVMDGEDDMTRGDAAWILSNAFLILTMQSGFGLLEAGSVSAKNIANIMVKNVIDVTLGGISYWTFGYGISFGEPSTPFCGMGNFFLTHNDSKSMGVLYTSYIFQFSFATAATTIVSGAVAERMRLTAYMLFSIYNTFVYCFPACWAWNKIGFLGQLGFHDFAGACVVHLTGGTSALVATMMLGPRIGRFTDTDNYSMSSPVTALTGTFMLWWAWLGFNCGSTFGLESFKWKLAAKVGVNTLNGSIAGGIVGLSVSTAIYRGHCYDITLLITSVLSGLVGVTAGCAVFQPWESLIVGGLSALVALGTMPLQEKFKIDDPVGAVPVHFGAALTSTLCVGLFAHNEFNILNGNEGLFVGGSPKLLGIQVLGVLCMVTWSAVATAIGFKLLDAWVGIRMTSEEEMLGADYVEHKIQTVNFAQKLEQAVRDLKIHDNQVDNIVQRLVMELGYNPELRAKSGRRHHSLCNGEPSEGVRALALALRDMERIGGQMLRGIPHTNSRVVHPVKRENTLTRGNTLPGGIEETIEDEIYSGDGKERINSLSTHVPMGLGGMQLN